MKEIFQYFWNGGVTTSFKVFLFYNERKVSIYESLLSLQGHKDLLLLQSQRGQ